MFMKLIYKRNDSFGLLHRTEKSHLLFIVLSIFIHFRFQIVETGLGCLFVLFWWRKGQLCLHGHDFCFVKINIQRMSSVRRRYLFGYFVYFLCRADTCQRDIHAN